MTKVGSKKNENFAAVQFNLKNIHKTKEHCVSKNIPDIFDLAVT